MAFKENATAVAVGGVAGLGVGMVGDYVNFKYPQTPAVGALPSVWQDRSLWINGGLALIGIGGAIFYKKREDVRLGLLSAGVVGLGKSVGKIVKSYQTAPADWAMYANKQRMAMRPTGNAFRQSGFATGTDPYNIK